MRFKIFKFIIYFLLVPAYISCFQTVYQEPKQPFIDTTTPISIAIHNTLVECQNAQLTVLDKNNKVMQETKLQVGINNLILYKPMVKFDVTALCDSAPKKTNTLYIAPNKTYTLFDVAHESYKTAYDQYGLPYETPAGTYYVPQLE